jgi:hypothetical protein
MWHRKWGVRLGAAATIVSAIVGSAIFLMAVTKFGLDGNHTLSIPREFLPLALFYSVIGLSVLSPVLSGLLTYLNEPEQVGKHTSSWADHSHVKDLCDALIRNLDVMRREDANKKLEDIEEAMARARDKETIRLTDRAINHAKERIKDADREIVSCVAT